MADSNADSLSDTARQVLAAVHAAGESTRPELSRQLRLSKPTISTAIAELETAGLVSPLRSQQGHTGRSAAVYGLAPAAGWLLGIDLGSTRIQLLARALDGTMLRHFSHVAADHHILRRADTQLVATGGRQIQKYVEQLTADHGPLRAAAIALPTIVPPGLDATATLHSPQGDIDLIALLADLHLPAATPVLVENNVNCAALAELHHGVAQDYRDFIYLQIGVAIGAGIIANGRLLRGGAGGAGEVATLPYPWTPDTPVRRFALEKYLSSEQFFQRVRKAWPRRGTPAPSTVPEIFTHAESGDPTAATAVKQHAGDIAKLALALAAVVDPTLIALGGGVGQHPLLAEHVARAIHRHRPDIEVRPSALGEDATVEGAVTLSAEHAYTTLLANHHNSRLDEQAAALVYAREVAHSS